MHEFIRAAKELIYPNGISISYIRITEGEYDTSTGTSTNTEVSTPLIAFPKNVRVNQYNYPSLISKEVMEYLIVATDLSTKPLPQDKVIRSGVTYTVDSVREHVAQGEIVIYKVICFKG